MLLSEIKGVKGVKRHWLSMKWTNTLPYAGTQGLRSLRGSWAPVSNPAFKNTHMILRLILDSGSEINLVFLPEEDSSNLFFLADMMFAILSS